MKKAGLFVSLLLLLAACNQQDSPAAETPSDTTSKPGKLSTEPVRDCYAWIKGKDSIYFSLDLGTGIRNGRLVYAWAEKDRNEGVWKGTIDENVLAGWYTFNSEGRQSVRQVAWKVVGNSLWPASGPVKQQQDTFYFSDPVHLQFDSTQAWQQVPCDR
ncbi:MAG: hypothetical protein JNL59_14490 [Chitinophagaceae bacterium]|jgi:hypothetical protein|nr:hypothetical protein [Chitinophagaceae bacterium]